MLSKNVYWIKVLTCFGARAVILLLFKNISCYALKMILIKALIFIHGVRSIWKRWFLKINIWFYLLNRPVLSVETVAYLTYEGVRFFEELELAVREQRERPVDLRPYLRRIHLVVTALREFIQTLQTYAKFSHFTDIDKARLRRIQLAVCSMRDLRQLFLLLIRRYNSSLQTRQYLNDVICGNHSLLVMIENTKMDVDIMTNHLTQ